MQRAGLVPQGEPSERVPGRASAPVSPGTRVPSAFGPWLRSGLSGLEDAHEEVLRNRVATPEPLQKHTFVGNRTEKRACRKARGGPTHGTHAQGARTRHAAPARMEGRSRQARGGGLGAKRLPPRGGLLLPAQEKERHGIAAALPPKRSLGNAARRAVGRR